MRQKICGVTALYMATCLPATVQAQAWSVIDTPAAGKTLNLEVPMAGGYRQYQHVMAMCVGNKLAFNFTADHLMKKPEVFISEGGFGETRFAGEFLKTNDGGPQIISLTPAASQHLLRYIAKEERASRKMGGGSSALQIGPGGNAAGDAITTTGFTALAGSTLTPCVK